jgi:signal transduction histidine kinase
VIDDGPGLADGEEDRIFQPGERGSVGERQGNTVSAGLGLALAQRLARAAGGDVETRPGPGGRFVLRLPAA